MAQKVYFHAPTCTFNLDPHLGSETELYGPCLEPITFYADSDPGFALKKKDQDPEHEHFFKIYWLFFLHLRSFFAF